MGLKKRDKNKRVEVRRDSWFTVTENENPAFEHSAPESPVHGIKQGGAHVGALVALRWRGWVRALFAGRQEQRQDLDGAQPWVQTAWLSC